MKVCFISSYYTERMLLSGHMSLLLFQVLQCSLMTIQRTLPSTISLQGHSSFPCNLDNTHICIGICNHYIHENTCHAHNVLNMLHCSLEDFHRLRGTRHWLALQACRHTDLINQAAKQPCA